MISLKQILQEGLSKILYHFTYTNNLINILKQNKFATSIVVGTNADQWKNKNKMFFFSTQRTKGMSGYGNHHGNVAIVLDGDKLSNTFKGAPVDYWGYSKNPKDWGNQYKEALLSNELEDRIITDKPYIDNAVNYILEIHIQIFWNASKNSFFTEKSLQELISLLKKYEISTYFYLDEKAFKLQDKRRAISHDQIPINSDIEDISEDEKLEREFRDVKHFIEEVLPIIIFNSNEINQLSEFQYMFLPKIIEYFKRDENIEKEINDKVEYKLNRYHSNSRSLFLDDEFFSIKNELHAQRGNPHSFIREVMKLLVDDMKKWKVNNFYDYFIVKFPKMKGEIR